MFLDEQIGQKWCIHTVDYYLAIERNEVLSHATTWGKLENTILSERSQAQETTNCMISFI